MLKGVDLYASIDKYVETQKYVELYAVIPSWTKIAKTYPEACRIVLDALAKSRGKDFYNYKEGQIDDKHLRQFAPRNIEGVFAFQLGTKYRGKSVEEVRNMASETSKGEVLLGIYEVAIILLCNPGIKYDGKWWGMDCAGDEWSFDGDGVFSGAPLFFFFFFFGELRFGTRYVSFASVHCGSVSAFVPQASVDSRSLAPVEDLRLESRVKSLEESVEAIRKHLIF